MKKVISRVLTIVLFLSVIFSAGTIKVKAEDKSYETMKAYYGVINTIVNGDQKDNKGIGIYSPSKSNPKNASGLVYANLIDFDSDGNKELFCYYLFNGSYVYEIWGFDGKAYKIQSVKDTTFHALRGNKVVSLLTVDNKTYIHVYDTYWGRGFTLGQAVTKDVFYTVSANKWVEAESLSTKPKLSDEEISSLGSKGIEVPQLGTEGNPIVYIEIKDGTNKELSKSEYENILKKYAGGTKIDLISLAIGGAGTVDIGVDVSQGNKQLGDFLSSISRMIMESLGLKDIYDTKTDEDKNALREFINNFVPDYGWHINSFDADNFAKGNVDDQIVFYLFRYGSMKKEITGVKTETNSDTGKGCWVIPLDKLNANCEKLFGVKIDPNNKNVNNGNYYLYVGNDDEGEELGKTDNQIVSVYQIADNIYCLNLNIATSYSNRQFYKTGYAIVKEVTIDGKKILQLLKYSNSGDMLTSDQLQEYRKQYNPEPKAANTTAPVNNVANKVSSNSASITVYYAIAAISIVVVGCGIYYKIRRNKKK